MDDQRAAHASEKRTWFDRALPGVRSLQFKATVLVTVLTLSVATTAVLYLLRSSDRLAQRERDEHVIHTASLLATATAEVLQLGDREALDRLAEDSADGRPLLYVVFYDAKGEQLAAADTAKGEILETLSHHESTKPIVSGFAEVDGDAREKSAFLDVTYPVTVATPPSPGGGPRQELIGYVRMGMYADRWADSISSHIDMMIGIGVLSTLLVVPLGFLLIRRITKPLENLAGAMHEFAHGNLKVRSRVRRHDEIGSVSSAFNTMADLHQQTHERIVRLNRELEERVAYRTQQLREIASREPLTGLFNRRHFGEVLERRFAEASRYGSDLSCIMLDLDKFKQANDEFGHQTGDEILIMTASTIVSQLRSSDVAARYGGDEFIILLPQTDGPRAAVLAERIAARFSRELSERFPNVPVSMSVGVSSLAGVEAADADALVRAADHALYTAKESGRNRVVAATPG